MVSDDFGDVSGPQSSTRMCWSPNCQVDKVFKCTQRAVAGERIEPMNLWDESRRNQKQWIANKFKETSNEITAYPWV